MCECDHSDAEVLTTNDESDARESATLIFLNPDLRIGFHIRKNASFERTFERMLESPLRAFQILCCGRSYSLPPLDLIDITRGRRVLEENAKYLVIHGNLIYNLAGAVEYKKDPQFERKLENTVRGLTGELDLGAALGAGVIVHIGASINREMGLKIIARTINHVLTINSDYAKRIAKHLGVNVDKVKKMRKIILENAAGEGNKLGSTLQEIATIFSHIDPVLLKGEQVKVCIDTAHIFGAGQYDFGLVEEVERFYEDFDKMIGVEYLEVFHLNDSRVPFNSKKDRHENLCKGYIFGNREDNADGSMGLKKFLEEAMSRHIVLIGEPPAKTAEREEGPGGVWDYEVIKRLVPAERRM